MMRKLTPEEEKQREALADRLKDREKRPSAEVFEDFGVPVLDETDSGAGEKE